jgi:hypothetical protein
MFLFFWIVHNTFAATGVKRQHVNGELQMPACIDAAAIDIVQIKGTCTCMMSFTYIVEQFFQMPVEFPIFNRLFNSFL